MKALNIFEIFGILVPGTIFTLGLVALYPDALGVLNKREFSFGDFGVILLVSYAIGNLIAGLGIILEKDIGNSSLVHLPIERGTLNVRSFRCECSILCKHAWFKRR